MPSPPPPSTPPPPQHPSPTLSALTFNLLAPCYKRLHKPDTPVPERESQYPALWQPRLAASLDLLLAIAPHPDIIALQEVWFHDPFIAQLEDALIPHYHIFYAPRSQSKPDGIATLVRRDSPYLAHPVPLDPISLADRVALAVTVQLLMPSTATQPSVPASAPQVPHSPPELRLPGTLHPPPAPRLLVVNTHLTFPHLPHDAALRLNQADAVARYAAAVADPRAPTLVLGDFNGDAESRPARRMRRDSFVNCYPSLHGAENRPVTHRNHRGQSVFVDHVFVRPPTRKYQDDDGLHHHHHHHLHRTDEVSGSVRAVRFTPSATASAFDDDDDDDAAADLFDDLDDDFDTQRDVWLPLPRPMACRKHKQRRSVSALRVEDAPFDSDGSPPPSPTPSPSVRAPVERARSAGAVTADGETGEAVTTLEPVSCVVYPEGLETGSWPACYDVSDHRPVCVTFRAVPWYMA